MKKTFKYVCFVIIAFVLLALLQNLHYAYQKEKYKEASHKACEVLNNYDGFCVDTIEITINGSTASGRSYTLSKTEYAEYFEQYMDLFWAEDVIFVEAESFDWPSYTYIITFSDEETGEALSLYVDSILNRIWYENIYFTIPDLDRVNIVFHQLMQNE